MSSAGTIQVKITVHPGSDFPTLVVEHVKSGQVGEFFGSVDEFMAEANHFGEPVEIVELIAA